MNVAAAEAGLRWLTYRWPGGTIRNEAEVYSGYYTEASSVLQPYYFRPDLLRLAAPCGGLVPIPLTSKR